MVRRTQSRERGGFRVYKGAIRGRQNGNLGFFQFRFLGKEGTMALVGKCAFVVGLVIAVAGGLGFEQA